MVQLRENIAAPPAQPPRYGLIAAAPVTIDNDFRWIGGWQYAPEQCQGGSRLAIDCRGGSAVKDVGSNPGFAEGDAFLVYAGDSCSTFGFEARDYVGRAQRQLAATESFEVADELWGGSLGLTQKSLTDSSSDTLTSAPAAILDALGCVEQGIGRLGKGRRGMVHMTPQLLTHLGAISGVYRDGQLWLTNMGNIVVADAGYDGSGPGNAAATTSQWMYGTSMIAVRLGPVDVIPGEFAQAMDRELNTVTYIAERAATFVWDDCVHVAAEVNIAACAFGGP